MTYRFFIAGIIQGSKQGLDVHDQQYRQILKRILHETFPGSHILCPVENHPESITYTNEKAQAVFFNHVAKVKECHGLVVYLPEASMGSAIELWEAFREKTLKMVISPMTGNWVVRILSDRLFQNIETFETFVRSGEMKRLLDARFGNEAGEYV
jgi:hypothetical protein